MPTSRQRNYAVLSAFLFCFFFAQALAISLLSIWLTRGLHLNGAQAGTVFAVNSAGALLAQPAYGYHMPNKAGVDEACIWGDYFYLEGLMRLRRAWLP